MALALSFNAEKHWTEERERILIAFFSNHSCLWSHRSEGYKNRSLRWKTLDQLRVLLCAQPPPAPLTVEDIKSKFKNLRTTFQRQYKMVKASQECCANNEFVPQWRHYHQLMFLKGCWEQGDTPDHHPLSPLTLSHQASPPVLTSRVQTFSFLPNPSTSASSCISPNIFFKSHWTDERECALISFYSEHSCLWNIKSENHNNRQLRLRLLEALKNQLSDNSVSFSVEDIKGKFKNLRTVFNREHKAVQASVASDKPYVSKWKHYLQLLFLSESCVLDNSPEHLLMLNYQDDKHLEQAKLTSSFSTRTFSSNLSQSDGNNLHLRHSPCSPNQSDSNLIERPAQGNTSSAPGCKKNSHTLVTMVPNPAPDTKCPAVSSSVEQPADNRLAAETGCLWTAAKVQQLISFYSEHSCLWNHRSDSYKNRPLRHTLLETLSTILSDSEPVSVEDIKTKFRNLRTIFQREHKAVSFNKTCGSGDFYLPKWKHYSDLGFLCDSGDEEHLLHEEPDNQRVENTSQSPAPSPSQQPSPSSSFPSSPSSHAGSHASGRKRGSGQLTSTDSQVLELLRTLCQNQSVSPHAGFLSYVDECLHEAPQNKVKTMKKRIVETIHSVMEQL